MVDLNKKCPTGIQGLDEILDGGLPRNRTVLLSGTCGTGKSTFAVQFLYKGIVEYNEPGILISLEQDPRELKQDMLHYGFDLQKLEDSGKLVIIDASLSRMGFKTSRTSVVSSSIGQPAGSMSLLPDEFNMERILEIVISKAKRIEAKRVVLDSLPALDFLIREGDSDIRHITRQIILTTNYRLKMEGLTSLLITEIMEANGAISAHGVESYVVDGAIILSVNEALDTRTVRVRKMRQTKHSLKPRTFEMTKDGILIRGIDKESKPLF
jgi:KaiC/GvpD/RAD55 family RecA-like ATPase